MPDSGAAPDLSVVIPAYNEESRLASTVDRVLEYLRQGARSYELIVVDDGSRDGTAGTVDAMNASGAAILLVRHPVNLGKGAAVRTGVLASKGDVVLFTDADLSTPITDADPLLRALLEGADVAIGSRALDRRLVEVHQPVYRETMGRIFNLFVRAILLPGLHDTQCGFKAFRGDIGRSLFLAMESRGFEFDPEVLYRARRQGLVIREIPVHWRNSPDTRVRALKDSARMFSALFRIRRRVR
ncbi:MAG TPA: dolichyl-phosphate beta-glucosyltransferase [Candidatus Dormibacteraeota bacterium]|nr:dolichyl-phosphate beta-glucosyltransferase [Candidatus Dormibacteraeota bacterium]